MDTTEIEPQPEYKYKKFYKKNENSNMKKTKTNNNSRVWDFFDKNLKTLIITIIVIIIIAIATLLIMSTLNKSDDSNKSGVMNSILSFMKGKHKPETQKHIQDIEDELNKSTGEPPIDKFYNKPKVTFDQTENPSSIDDIEDDSELVN